VEGPFSSRYRTSSLSEISLHSLCSFFPHLFLSLFLPGTLIPSKRTVYCFRYFREVGKCSLEGQTWDFGERFLLSLAIRSAWVILCGRRAFFIVLPEKFPSCGVAWGLSIGSPSPGLSSLAYPRPPCFPLFSSLRRYPSRNGRGMPLTKTSHKVAVDWYSKPQQSLFLSFTPLRFFFFFFFEVSRDYPPPSRLGDEDFVERRQSFFSLTVIADFSHRRWSLPFILSSLYPNYSDFSSTSLSLQTSTVLYK